MKFEIPKCPTCGQRPESVLYGDCLLMHADPDHPEREEFEWRGETEINWDSQETMYDEHDRASLFCCNGHAWPSKVFEYLEPERIQKALDKLRQVDGAAYAQLLLLPFGPVPAHAMEDKRAAWWWSDEAWQRITEIEAAIELAESTAASSAPVQRIPVAFDESQCSGAFDGFTVSSDADPGL